MKPHEILEYLSKAIKTEIETENLQKLDEEIYDIIAKSVGDKRDELTEHFARVAANYLVLLFAIRLLKVIRGADTRLATQKERLVFHKYDEFRKSLRTFVSAVRTAAPATKKTSRLLVVFNTRTEAFIDSELNPLGPFEKNDMAYIPEEDALILSRYGIVEILLGE